MVDSDDAIRKLPTRPKLLELDYFCTWQDYWLNTNIDNNLQQKVVKKGRNQFVFDSTQIAM